MMKPLKSHSRTLLSLYLVLLSLTGNAQATEQEVAPIVGEKPFELGMYMGVNRTVNLMLLVRQVKGITLKIKNADDITIHELRMKRSPRAYHYKLNFADSVSGEYKLEISDGRKTLVRWIEVADVPATEAQRFITLTSPFTP